MSYIATLSAGSATQENRAENGRVTDLLVECYERLAKGMMGGLIITSHWAVTEQGRAHKSVQVLLESDDTLPGIRRIAEVCHAHGTPVICQISHAGRVAEHDHPLNIDNMSEADFEAVVRTELLLVLVIYQLCISPSCFQTEAFVQAARRVKMAGFDGIELHCAHGRLGLLAPVLFPPAKWLRFSQHRS